MQTVDHRNVRTGFVPVIRQFARTTKTVVQVCFVTEMPICANRRKKWVRHAKTILNVKIPLCVTLMEAFVRLLDLLKISRRQPTCFSVKAGL